MNMIDEINNARQCLYDTMDKIHEIHDEMIDVGAENILFRPHLEKWVINLHEIDRMLNHTEGIVFYMGVDPEPDPEEE